MRATPLDRDSRRQWREKWAFFSNLPGGKLKTRVILTCGDEETRQAYIQKIAGLDVGIDAVSSLSELYRHLLEKSYNGILIDLKTKMRASGREKELIHSLLDSFPVVQLTMDKATGEIRSLSSGSSASSKSATNFGPIASREEKCLPIFVWEALIVNNYLFKKYRQGSI